MKYFSLIALIILLSSCEDKDVKGISINVFEDQIPIIAIEDLVYDISYIPLETNNQSLIGNIDKILIQDSIIYILDSRIGKKLCLFDLNGVYLNKIDKIGKGPGEFSNPIDFSIDYSNRKNIFLNDFAKKIISYDQNCKFIGETSTTSARAPILVDYKKQFYLYTSRYPPHHPHLS